MTDRSRVAWQVGLAAAGLGLLALPVIAVSLSETAGADPLWTALRLAALLGLTLVFMDIMVGALRPLLVRVFRPRTVQRLHVVVGLAGFSLVVGHAIMLLVFGLAGYSVPFMWIGPAVLATLLLTMLTAWRRRNFRRSWKWIHRLNYLAFAAALVHGMRLGSDLRAEPWLRGLLLSYAAAVVIALIWRVTVIVGKRRSG